jgi:hypothetical protein
MLTLLLKGVQNISNFLIEDFFHLPPVFVHLELRIFFPAIIEKKLERNGLDGILTQGLGGN